MHIRQWHDVLSHYSLQKRFYFSKRCPLYLGSKIPTSIICLTASSMYLVSKTAFYKQFASVRRTLNFPRTFVENVHYNLRIKESHTYWSMLVSTNSWLGLGVSLTGCCGTCWCPLHAVSAVST